MSNEKIMVRIKQSDILINISLIRLWDTFLYHSEYHLTPEPFRASLLEI